MRTLLLLLAALGIAGPARGQSGSRAARPNIVWISAEDLSPHLGAYGDRVARTPNLDRMAKGGVRYTNAFSTYGVCAPSRFSIITGLYPSAYGAEHMRTMTRTASIAEITDPELLAIPTYEAVPPPQARLLPELLRMAGYYTTNNAKEDYQFRAPVTAWDESSKKAHWRNRPDKSQPFFAVFNIEDTHESQVWKRKGQPLVTDPASVTVPPYYPDTPAVRRDIAQHYDNIASMDRKAGEILRQLEEDGLLENTIVFFWGDHGDGLPRSKRWVYDTGTRVPLLIRYPDGKSAGTVEDRLVSLIDLAPSVLSLAGVPIPAYMQGVSFLGSQQGPERRYVYAARDRMDPARATRRAVRDHRYQYVRNYHPELPYLQFLPYRDQMDIMKELYRVEKAGGLNEVQMQLFRKTKPMQELYDTQDDPWEIHNLADDPRYAAKLMELRAEQERWWNEIHDTGLIPEPVLKNILWPPYGEQPRTAAPEIRVERRAGKKVIVTMSSTTEGASIGYRLPGETSWRVYTGPVGLAAGTSIEAVAHRIGYLQSKPVVWR